MNNVAVIITTKDRPDYLDRAFNSVINQSLSPDEIIIIDDFSDVRLGSDTLRKYNESSLNIGAKFKYHFNESAYGGNFSRNLGVQLSSSPVLMFLDDDDFWVVDKIRDQLQLVNSGEKFIYTGKNFVNSDNLSKVIRKSIEREGIKSIWAGNYIGSTSGVTLTRDVFIAAGQFDESLMSLQDFDLWVRCLRICPAVWDGKFNLLYTVHKDKKQISTNVNKHMSSINTIHKKYHIEIAKLPFLMKRKFTSRLNHLLARAHRKNKDYRFFIYLFKSLYQYPSLRTLALIFKY